MTAPPVFVCMAALTILDAVDEVLSPDDQETVSFWLSERQLPNGGLNGRPEKLEDVCYSFWVLSALAILNKLEWIDRDKLVLFILSAQVRWNDKRVQPILIPLSRTPRRAESPTDQKTSRTYSILSLVLPVGEAPSEQTSPSSRSPRPFPPWLPRPCGP